jgi:hypothetical protein
MRRLMRLFFRVVVMPLVVLLLGIYAASKLVPQTRLRAMAAGELGRRMNRQIEIGTIHLGLRGLLIDDLRLSEVPSFQAGTAVSAKGVGLGWNLRTLWNGLDVRKKFITRSSGRFHIDEFHHPYYSARDFSLTWSLSDMDPTWCHLNGWARLKQGPGLLENVDQLVATSPSAKLALAPVMMLTNLERTGFVNFGLPDLRRWPLKTIEGDYRFDKGFMRINRFSIASPQLGMEASGTVELATEKLSLDVELKSPARTVLGALDVKMHVSGTVSNPKADLESLKKKAFKATLSNLLQGGQGATEEKVKDALQNLFH